MIFNYLWYNLYRAERKSSLKNIPYFLSGGILGCLISLNLMTINGLLAKLDLVPDIYSSLKTTVIIHGLTIILVMLYYRGNRAKKIIVKYDNWEKKERRKGTWLTIMFIMLSFIFMFIMVNYKPGYFYRF
jgi:hypothetical protein